MPIPETTPTLLPLTAPVIDCEPPAVALGATPPVAPCPAPTVLRRHTPRRLRLVDPQPEPQPERQLPAGAAQFADMALRRVLEVVDRRRPPAQLKTLMSQLLLDAVVTAAKTRHGTTASLRRVGLRPAAPPATAEVFATYTRGARVRAIAGRIELRSGRWQLTALQLG
ncbi:MULTISPECIES: Rv3235 family protein [unclassified Mycolicibacterium]|uniref:Rv3235 family protein n=1 Tax=unclassified Mycolicibacterium TaxID=2636767 RepID=UPI001391653A|nr:MULTISPECIES: Rv3235 family protein [unclassified Mycolicibacterium]